MSQPKKKDLSDEEIDALLVQTEKPDGDGLSDEEIDKMLAESEPGQPYSGEESGPGLGQTLLEQSGQGLALGYLPHLQAATQPYTDRAFKLASMVGLGPKGGSDVEPQSLSEADYIKSRDENIKRMAAQKEAYPIASTVAQIGGGLVGGLATTPLFAPAKGAGLLASVKAGAKQGGILGAVQNPGDVEGERGGLQLLDRAGPTAIGTGLGGILGGAGQMVSSTGKWVKDTMRSKPKPNAAEIEKATEELGGKATTGMLSADETVQNLESSLSQNPYEEGKVVAGYVQQAWDALENGVKAIEEKASKQTAQEVGDQIKNDLVSAIGERHMPVQALYEGVAPDRLAIQVNPNSIKSVVRNIVGHPDAVLENRALTSRIGQELEQIQNIDQLGKLITALQSKASVAYRSGDSATSRLLTDIVGKLKRLETRSITRSAIDSAGEKGGREAAKDVIRELKEARKGYKGLMDFLEELGGYTKTKGRKTASQFIDSVENIPSIELVEKMVQKKNVEAMRSLQKTLPDTFEALRKLEVLKIISKSTNKTTKMVEPQKLINEVESRYKDAPEIKRMILGNDGIKTMEQVALVKGALPKMSGPSGTPKGLLYSQGVSKFFTKQFWWDKLARKLDMTVYEAAGKSLKSEPISPSQLSLYRKAGQAEELGRAAPGLSGGALSGAESILRDRP